MTHTLSSKSVIASVREHFAAISAVVALIISLSSIYAEIRHAVETGDLALVRIERIQVALTALTKGVSATTAHIEAMRGQIDDIACMPIDAIGAIAESIYTVTGY